MRSPSFMVSACALALALAGCNGGGKGASSSKTSVPTPIAKLSLQYFDIGSDYVSVASARREADVLLTEGQEGTWQWGRPDYNFGNRANGNSMAGLGWGGWNGEVLTALRPLAAPGRAQACAAARGLRRPRCVRIFAMTGDSRMAAMIFSSPPQFGQCSR